SGTPLSAYRPNSFLSSGMAGLYIRYCAGMIWSVSMSSPSTYALPAMMRSMMFPMPGFREYTAARGRSAGPSRPVGPQLCCSRLGCIGSRNARTTTKTGGPSWPARRNTQVFAHSNGVAFLSRTRGFDRLRAHFDDRLGLDDRVVKRVRVE